MKRKPTPAAAASDEAFAAFVAASAGRLQRIAELITGDPHQAADLTQSALERAYLNWPRVQADDPMAYVRKIVVNQYRDWLRARMRRPERSTGLLPERPAAGDFADRHAQRDLVLGALSVLTRRERQVVVLRYFADLSGPQIAEELDIAHGTVKSTLARAIDKLRVVPELAAHARAKEDLS